MFASEGDDCLQRAKREDAGRFSKEGKSLDDFCRAFGHSKARQTQSFLSIFIKKRIESTNGFNAFLFFHFTFSASHDGIDENAQNRRISVSSPYECTAETDFGERKSEI